MGEVVLPGVFLHDGRERRPYGVRTMLCSFFTVSPLLSAPDGRHAGAITFCSMGVPYMPLMGHEGLRPLEEEYFAGVTAGLENFPQGG